MLDPVREAERAAALLAQFERKGASRVEPGYLLPADTLLDLYGEAIRSRAYRTQDPVQGETILRPDFTVPVVEAHMARDTDIARYTYAGPVWRRQSYGVNRAREYWQVGLELLGDANRAAADAEVFVAIRGALGAGATGARTGDLAFLLAAVDGIRTTEARKAALRRHVWRPRRFKRLLERFAGVAPFDADTRDLPDVVPEDVQGVRGRPEIAARLDRIREERETPSIAREEHALFETLEAMNGSAAACLKGMEALGRTFPNLRPPTEEMARRLDALDRSGVGPDDLPFDPQFGRTTMEYYDGFVFAFRGPPERPDVATGGRYDALTEVLGNGRRIPAVGGVIRPAILLAMEAQP